MGRDCFPERFKTFLHFVDPEMEKNNPLPSHDRVGGERKGGTVKPGVYRQRQRHFFMRLVTDWLIDFD